MKKRMLFSMVLILFIGAIACDRDDITDDPIIKKELYEIIGDVASLEETECKDTIPYYNVAGAEYLFSIKNNVYISTVKMNLSNSDQWVYTKAKIIDVSKGQVYYVEKVYFYDLNTNESLLLDSSNSINAIAIGGNKIAYSSVPRTAVYDISSQTKEVIEGVHASLSPNGINIKVYDFSSNGDIKFYSTSNFNLLQSVPYGGGGPSDILWLNDYDFVDFTIEATNGYASMYRRWSLSNGHIDTLFFTKGLKGGKARIWIEKPTTMVVGKGYLFNLETTEISKLHDFCANKYYDDYIDIGKGSEFIGQKIYFEVDEENKEVIYSTYFHLLKPFEGLEKRIKFVFDTDEF